MPSARRPALAVRAVRSVLNQACRVRELIVVIDAATLKARKCRKRSRIRARNATQMDSLSLSAAKVGVLHRAKPTGANAVASDRAPATCVRPEPARRAQRPRTYARSDPRTRPGPPHG